MNKKTKILTIDQFNVLLDYCETTPNINWELFKYSTYLKLETHDYIYQVSLTGETNDIFNIGALANEFYRKCNVHDIRGKYGYTEIKTISNKTKIKWDYETAYGYQYNDKYYAGKELICWGYDINSAFPYAMLMPMPDTRQEPRYNSDIKKGEIGFYKHGGVSTTEGDYAEIIFPLMDSPFKLYVLENFKLKSELKGKEKDRYKKRLNYVTGLLARRNIFLRNALIFYSNKYIKSFIDENTVYCNVDCIVSLVPRNDLPIGTGLGQFKTEYEAHYFKYLKNCIYQWGDECHYSGIPRGCIKDIEQIDNWWLNLPYIFENGRIVKNEKKKI